MNVGANTLTALNATITAIEQKYPVIICPAVAPLFNGSVCLGCLPGQYFNLGTLKCQNPNLISNIVALRLNKNYLTSSTYNITTLQAAVAKVPYPVKACPPSTPLFNGTLCIACANGLIYDLFNKKCVSCASSYYFNTTNNLCQPTPLFYPNLHNTNWIVNNSTGLVQLFKMLNKRKLQKGSRPCPNSAPNYDLNTNTCGKCAIGQLWNYNNYTCMVCPSGLQVDPNTKTCLMRIVGAYQTNLSSVNLLFNGISKAQYQYVQSQNFINYPYIKDCPLSAPYFDGFKCIACHAPYPLFSMLHKTCASCPTGTIYHQNTFVCLTPNGGLVTSPPNLGKMYSSIF